MSDDLKMPRCNSIQVSGRLTRDPELRQIPSGTAICDFGIAVDDGFGDKQKTYFFNVKVWGDQGERVAGELKKGYPVIIDGKLTSNNFDDKDGNKRTAYDIIAFRVQCLRWANNGEQRGTTPGGGHYKPDTSNNSTGVQEPVEQDDIPF